jgi:hypothetical protein
MASQRLQAAAAGKFIDVFTLAPLTSAFFKL